MSIPSEHAAPPPGSGFDCREDPFRTGFDDRFVYLSRPAQGLLEWLRGDLRLPTGLSVLTGQPGTGKTTLLNWFAASLQPDDPFLLFLAVPVPTLDDLVRVGRQQAGVTGEQDLADVDPRFALRGLLAGSAPDRLRLIVIDEAQSLPDPLLDYLLELAALGAKGSGISRIILAGDQTLSHRLALAPFGERVRSLLYPYELTALDRSEVAPFIHHRLEVAGCRERAPFTPAAIDRIADYAQGVPETINALCRLAFFLTTGHGESRITADAVELAASAALLNCQNSPSFTRSVPPPILRTDQDGGAVSSLPTASATDEGRASPESDAGLAPTLGPQGIAAIVAGRGDDGQRLTTFQGTTTADVYRPRGRRGGFGWAAMTVAVILGVAALVPHAYDAPGAASFVPPGWLNALVGTRSSSPGSPSGDRDTTPPLKGPGSLRVTLGRPDALEIAPEAPDAATMPVDDRSLVALEALTDPKVQPDSSISATEQPSGSDDTRRPTPSDPQEIFAERQAAADGGEPAEELGLHIQNVAIPISLDVAALDAVEVERLLALAEAHFRADRLVAPRFDNALAAYRKVFQADPENRAALAGVDAINAKLIEYARAEAERGDLAGARRQLAKIRMIEAEGLDPRSDRWPSIRDGNLGISGQERDVAFPSHGGGGPGPPPTE